MFASLKNSKSLKIAVDASNLRDGGGVTHLTEFLAAAMINERAVDFIVYGSEQTLDKIIDNTRILKKTPAMLNYGGLARFIWRTFFFSKDACGNDILFCPGGYVGLMRGIRSITMCRNMLPFEWHEAKRFGISLMLLKLILLRVMQGYSFKKADGVIFLTDYAKNIVEQSIKLRNKKCKVIPHGLSDRFRSLPRRQFPFKGEKPINLIYVSPIYVYKHHWLVVRAVSEVRLRLKQDIRLILIGGGNCSRLDQAVAACDFNNEWVKTVGVVEHDDLAVHYKQADLAVFASSCENMPNTLVEMMGAGLPIACSDRGPMPEVLGESDFYFNPEDRDSLIDVLVRMLESVSGREAAAERAVEKASTYSWERCAAETLEFISQVAEGR